MAVTILHNIYEHSQSKNNKVLKTHKKPQVVKTWGRKKYIWKNQAWFTSKLLLLFLPGIQVHHHHPSLLWRCSHG